MSKDPNRRVPGVCRSMYMRMEEIDQERAASGWNPYVGEEEYDERRPAGMTGGRSAGWPMQGPQNAEAMPLMQDEEDRRAKEPPTSEARSAAPVMPPNQQPQSMPLVQDETDRWSQRPPISEARSAAPVMPPNQQPQSMPLVQDETDWGDEAWEEKKNPEASANRADAGNDARPAWLPQEDLNTGTEQAAAPAVPHFRMPDCERQMRQEWDFEQDLRRLQSLYPESAGLLLPHVEEECDKMEYEGSQMYCVYPDREQLNRLAGQIYEKVREQFPPMQEQRRDEQLAMQSCESCAEPGENWVEDMIRLMLLQEMYRRRCRHARKKTC